MATQLGDVQISSIEGTLIRGHFRSVYDKNVGSGSTRWGAAFLYDALSSLCDIERSEGDLLPFIKSVAFTSPGAAATDFVVEVTDPAVLKGLTTGFWESYFLG